MTKSCCLFLLVIGLMICVASAAPKGQTKKPAKQKTTSEVEELKKLVRDQSQAIQEQAKNIEDLKTVVNRQSGEIDNLKTGLETSRREAASERTAAEELKASVSQKILDTAAKTEALSKDIKTIDAQVATVNKDVSATKKEASDWGKISGIVFGEYYYFIKDHRSDVQGRNGFWFRRVYFTYDKKLGGNFLGGSFDSRLRLEMNGAGDFVTRTPVTPYIKEAYLRWTHGNQAVLLGLSTTPTWEANEEVFWGYRHLEKLVADLQGLGPRSDFGIAARGFFDSGKRFTYHGMIANGTGINSAYKAKKAYLALGAYATPHLFFEVYGDYEGRPNHTNRYIWQTFAGYKQENMRLAAQFTEQFRQGGLTVLGNNLPLQHIRLASVYGIFKLASPLWAVLRYDRSFDPLPDGNGISYLPFDPRTKSNLVIAALDWRITDRFSFIPNLELVSYGKANGLSVRTDIVPRMTFSYKF